MFVGSRGFTIPKSELTDVQEQQLIRELTFDQDTSSTLYAFRSSPTKYYVPKFYGFSKFGSVPIRIPLGLPIDVPFHGAMREDQLAAVDAFVEKKTGLLQLPCGFGKTVVALHLIHLFKRKTLIIVHMEFLLTQWMERIQQFLPTARVGRIQGNVIDIDDKDIVIGMLQSISMKSYPLHTFSQFGFTIFDETHHMAADTFSNALFTIVTPIMLGMSATMERKDGKTKVIKLFMGDLVYKAERELTPVFVHKITYHTKDATFNENLTNANGQCNYSGMLSKICNFEPRHDAILHILKQVLAMPTTSQVMLLAHQKQVLTYLNSAILEQHIGTVGFYVGGMKPSALKETEEKQIVLATYAMAQEGLDIKTLTTLMLLTPKNDVTQAIGRILRTRHTMPLVLDIVDKHGVFAHQWKKRKEYYQSQQYIISEHTHDSYPSTAPAKRAKYMT